MESPVGIVQYPTWKKYIVMACAVDKLNVKEKRRVFGLMRTVNNANPNTFLPHYGITLAEFSTWQILMDGSSKN
jgi:hypothetical protein